MSPQRKISPISILFVGFLQIFEIKLQIRSNQQIFTCLRSTIETLERKRCEICQS